MRLVRQGAAISLAAAALSACMPEKDVGYVEIKTFPTFAIPLYLDTVKVAELNGGSALMSHSVGRTTLQLQRNGQFFPICEFEVRKNRIVTVTISPVDRSPRCSVKS